MKRTVCLFSRARLSQTGFAWKICQGEETTTISSALFKDVQISRASEKCPDLVLMDIRIKGNRDGIETAALLRDRFGVPVIYLTAHADEATLERAKQTEPYGYLVKPVKSAELRSAIEIAIYRHAMEKRLREREHNQRRRSGLGRFRNHALVEDRIGRD